MTRIRVTTPVLPGELCADCDNPATEKALAGYAVYGFCPDHLPADD